MEGADELEYCIERKETGTIVAQLTISISEKLRLRRSLYIRYQL